MCYQFTCDVHMENPDEWTGPKTITVRCPKHGIAHDALLMCPECHREAARYTAKNPATIFNNPWPSHTPEVVWPVG